MIDHDPTLRQIEKILALVDSDQEGEALTALRTARRMTADAGISFTDLIMQAKRGRLASLRGLFSDDLRGLEEEIDALHKKIYALADEKESLLRAQTQKDEYLRMLEIKLTQQENETKRWKDIAHESAEKLWEIGRLAHAEAMLEMETATKPKRQKRRAAG